MSSFPAAVTELVQYARNVRALCVHLKAADRIAEHLQAAPVLHADESSLRLVGKLHWLHIAASQTLTGYIVAVVRGPSDAGVLVTLDRQGRRTLISIALLRYKFLATIIIKYVNVTND